MIIKHVRFHLHLYRVLGGEGGWTVARIKISRIFLPLSSPGGDINLANDTKMDDKNGIKMIRKNYINNIL